MADEKLSISVNICTLNEENNIEECIRSVKDNNPFEIIVIDGNSNDKTIQIAEKLKVKVIKSERGLASQRQTGINASSQKYIALVDADDRLDENCLSTLLIELEENKFDAIQALNFAYNPKTYWERAMANTLIVEGRLPKEVIMVGRPALYLASSIKRAKFDPFFNISHEDTDLSKQFEDLKFKQGIGTGKSYRKHEKNLRSYMKKWKNYGKGDAHFVYKYPGRKWAIIRHLLINYPLVKPWKGKIKYAPFHILMGVGRFIYFLQEYILLKFKNKQKFKI